MSFKVTESLLLHILGQAEDSPKVESQRSCDEHETTIACSSHGEKIEALVQDSLEAHKEFLQSQREPVEQADKQYLCKDLEAEQPDEGLMIEKQDDDCYSPEEMQKNIEEDLDSEESPERSDIEAEERVNGVNRLSDEKHLRDEPDIGIDKPQRTHLETKSTAMNGHETEEHRRVQGDWKQPDPLPPMAPSDPADMALMMSSDGPGPLVTDLEEVEPPETIHLQSHQPLCIADLPDLEDMDTEDKDITGFLVFQEGTRPKIQILSGYDDNLTQCQHEVATATSSPGLLFKKSDHNTLIDDYEEGVAIVDPGAEDATMPVIFKSLEGSIPNQNSKSPPNHLIEELD